MQSFPASKEFTFVFQLISVNHVLWVRLVSHRPQNVRDSSGHVSVRVTTSRLTINVHYLHVGNKELKLEHHPYLFILQ